MAFFDELGKALSDTGTVVVGKTKDITGALQMKAKVSQEKDKVNQAYIELGKAFYDILQMAPEERFAETVKAISDGQKKIEELEHQIMELEGTRVCAECGAKIPRGGKFCSKCGAPLPEMPPKNGPDLAGEWADAAGAAESAVDEKMAQAAKAAGDAADDVVRAAAEVVAGAAAAAEAVGQDIAAAADRAVNDSAEAADTAAQAAQAPSAETPGADACASGKPASEDSEAAEEAASAGAEPKEEA